MYGLMESLLTFWKKFQRTAVGGRLGRGVVVVVMELVTNTDNSLEKFSCEGEGTVTGG